jgi:hypothetical protein
MIRGSSSFKLARDDLEVTAQGLESSRWVIIGVYGDETEARIEPFDVVPIDVASWWPPESPLP